MMILLLNNGNKERRFKNIIFQFIGIWTKSRVEKRIWEVGVKVLKSMKAIRIWLDQRKEVTFQYHCSWSCFYLFSFWWPLSLLNSSFLPTLMMLVFADENTVVGGRNKQPRNVGPNCLSFALGRLEEAVARNLSVPIKLSFIEHSCNLMKDTK